MAGETFTDTLRRNIREADTIAELREVLSWADRRDDPAIDATIKLIDLLEKKDRDLANLIREHADGND